jgi:hypothetical protein
MGDARVDGARQVQPHTPDPCRTGNPAQNTSGGDIRKLVRVIIRIGFTVRGGREAAPK